MKKRIAVLAVMSAAVCLTGCGSKAEFTTVQGNTVPIAVDETTVWDLTDYNTDESTGTGSGDTKTTTAAVKETVTGTGTSISVTTAGTNRTTAGTGTAGTGTAGTGAAGTGTAGTGAAGTNTQQNTDRSNQAATSGPVTQNSLLGKWETVSFSKDTGASTRYDLADPAHRSCYIGLDLQGEGRAFLTVGTEEHRASYSIIGTLLSVRTEDGGSPVIYDFSVSDDRRSLTVSLLNGRVTATLKPINRDFSILPYLFSEPLPDDNNIVGNWYLQELDQQNYNVENGVFVTIGYLTVNRDGTYVYQPGDGSLRKRGKVRIQYEELAGERYAYYAFYDDETNAFWHGTNTTEPNGRGILPIGNGGTLRLRPKEVFLYDYERYVGMWESGRCSIQIGTDRDRAVYHVTVRWAEDASEDYEWSYDCSGNDNGTLLECMGGGTLTRIVTAGGTETRSTVYSDGVAVFRLNGDVLLWQDGKEDRGNGMTFTRIG